MRKSNRYDFAALNAAAQCEVAKATVRVDLSQYTVVRAADLYARSTPRIERFARCLGEAASCELAVCEVTAEEEKAPQRYEILIGNTGRAESIAAKAEIKGAGYLIKVVGDKLVIVGTTNYLVLLALDHLLTHYLDGVEGSLLTLPERISCGNLKMLSLADDELCNYVAVYDAELDDDRGNCPEPHGPSNKESNPDQVDFAVHACYRLRELFVQLTGCEATSYKTVSDAAPVAPRELRIGNMKRDRVAEILADLEMNEYGIFTDDKDIMVLGWNENTLMKAYDMFRVALHESYIVDEWGTRIYYLPAFMADKQVMDTAWVMDFPKPEAKNLILRETVDVADDSLEYIYVGEGVSERTYAAYLKRLERSGYTRYSENKIADNRFATYVNREAGVVLHVQLTLYAFAEKYRVDQFPRSLRVISAPLSSVQLYREQDLVREQIFDRVTDTMFTSLEQDRPAGSVLGNFYIMTLEDGSFFIVDGGMNKGAIGNDYYLWTALCKLYERVKGHKPTKEDPVVIAGWYMSHFHGDHTTTLRAFCRRFADETFPLRFEYFFFNAPSESEQFNLCQNPQIETWQSLLGAFADRAICIKPHMGDKFYLRNVEFEVLYTHENMHPFMLDYGNETSTVMRATIRHTDGGGNEDGKEVTLLIPGDMNRYAAKNMLSMFGDYFKSDMMIVAHHGWVGPRRVFYDTVSPKILWWPTFINDFKHMTKEGRQNHSWYHMRVNYYNAHHLPSVKYIFVQDTYDATLVIGKEGIDYDNILDSMFDLIDEKPLAFNTESFIKK